MNSSKFQKVKTEELESVKELFKKRLPKSCRILNILTMKILNILPKENLIHFYAFDGNLSSSSFVISVQHFEDMNGGYYIMISQPDSVHITDHMLSEFELFLNWSEKLHFDVEASGPLLQFFKKVSEKRQRIGKNVNLSIHDVYAYMIDPSDARRITRSTFTTNLYEKNGSVVVRSLETDEDIFVVNSNWTYKSGHSLGFIQTGVKWLPSGGVFKDGQLVSWGLTSIYGSINALATLESHRGQGYGKLVTHFIAQCQARAGLIPCSRTIRSNIPAQKVMEAVGFVKTHDNHWIDYYEK